MDYSASQMNAGDAIVNQMWTAYRKTVSIIKPVYAFPKAAGDMQVNIANNPFMNNSQSLRIDYSVAQPAHISISIYNLSGAKVRELARGQATAGKHSVSWDGKNQQGILVTNGSYQIVSLINGFSQAKKIMVIK